MAAANETLTLLEDAAERTFSELCTKAVIDAAEAGTWPEALWAAADELGFTHAALPETANGAGLPLDVALTLAKITGRFALPIPLWETAIAAWLLDCAGHTVAAGPMSFGPVDRRNSCTLTARAGGWILKGAVHALPWGNQARRVALIIPTPTGAMVASVNPALGSSSTRTNLAGEPRTRLQFADVQLSQSDVRPLPSALPQDIAYLLGALLRTTQIAGALAHARDLAVRYTADRIAFGKPLNKLQAVQQNLAVLAGQAAAASVAADMALDALANAPPALLETSIALAKVRAGEAAGIGASLAHQLHGAIGFTHEHMLHHLTRRLWSWRDEFGNEAYWAARAGQTIISNGAADLWTCITQTARL